MWYECPSKPTDCRVGRQNASSTCHVPARETKCGVNNGKPPRRPLACLAIFAFGGVFGLFHRHLELYMGFTQLELYDAVDMNCHGLQLPSYSHCFAQIIYDRLGHRNSGKSPNVAEKPPIITGACTRGLLSIWEARS